jgi:hypothetical protein
VTDDLVTRLRQRIDQITDERDQARAERDRARARCVRLTRAAYEQRGRAELWKRRALRR